MISRIGCSGDQGQRDSKTVVALWGLNQRARPGATAAGDRRNSRSGLLPVGGRYRLKAVALMMNKLGVSRTKAAAIAIATILAAGWLAYSDSFRGPFVYDDQISIVQNSTLHGFWSALRPLYGRGTTVEGRPVLNFSLAVNHAISGLDIWSYHAANVMILVLSGLTLFGIVRRTLDRMQTAGSPAGSGPVQAVFRPEGKAAADPCLVAFAIALLWTVHPLQTEAVTYVIQRAESLMGLFYLVTLYGFVRFSSPNQTAKGAAAWAVLSVFACFLGVGTKEVMASAPVMVFFYDRTFVSGSFAGAWRKRWAYHLGLASSWIPLAALVEGGGGNRSGSIGFGTSVSWLAYAFTQFRAIGRYLWLSFWPHPLIFDYGKFWIHHPWSVVASAIAVFLMIAVTLWALRFRPAVGFLGAFFFAILAPTSLLPGTTQMIVEHRMYLPLAAVLTLAVAGAARLFSPRAFGGLACSAAAALAVVTFQRNAVYRTELGLWDDTVTKCPDNNVARNNLGLCLNEAGRPTDAIVQFRAILRTDPVYVEAHNNLGNVLAGLGRNEEAALEYERAVVLKPDWAEAHFNLGSSLDALGRDAEAVAQYREALRLKPDFAEAHGHLGLALDRAGRLYEAIDQFTQALQIRPGWADDCYNLGVLLEKAGQNANAIAQFEGAVQAKPDWADARYNLGLALYQAGRIPEAAEQLQQVLRIKPDYAGARAALQMMGQ